MTLDNVIYPVTINDKLYTALAQAQAEFKRVGKANEGFQRRKFADKDALMNHQWPILKSHGLSIHERIELRGDIEILKVVLMHESGQEVSTECILRYEDKTYTKWSAAVTFQSRTLYRGILGIAICEDVEDDDGHEQQKAEYNKPHNPVSYKQESVTPDQIDELMHVLEGHKDLYEQVMKGFGITSLSQIPKEKFISTMDRIRELKYKKEQINK